MHTERRNGHLDPVFNNIKGVGSIILNKDHQILVGTETEDKPLHRRRAGMVSIPIETVKPFERRNPQGLLLAGLAEVLTDENILRVGEFLEQVGIIEDPVLVDSENDIIAAVAVFHWVGDPEVNPFMQAQTDLSNLRWMDTAELLVDQELRPYAEVIISHAETRGYLNGKPSCPIPVLKHFSPSRHAIAREKYDDVSR